MLQYLVILLDDVATSYCHYQNNKEKHLISIEDLKAGIFFAMKENLTIQFVYPDYKLPKNYKEAIDSIDHSNVVSSLCEDTDLKTNADIIVFNCWEGIGTYPFKSDHVCVMRTGKKELFSQYETLKTVMGKVARLNVVITDVETFTDADFEKYKEVLNSLSKKIVKLYCEEKNPQLNLLTDRILLDKMNNCNAGWANITLAPDGKFYVCPAFYLAGDDEDFGLGKAKFNIGDLKTGLDIKNPQLYKLKYAPLCRDCDAYQCKRCIWLNRKTTYEINTPSHEQCVMAHLERNASRELLANIRKLGQFMPEKNIKEVDYLDPFEVKNRWQKMN